VVVPESFPGNIITDRSVTYQINVDSKHTSKKSQSLAVLNINKSYSCIIQKV